MTTPDPQPCDDVLARARAALRRTPVPEEPSEEAAAHILATLHAASGLRRPSQCGEGSPCGPCGPRPPPS